MHHHQGGGAATAVGQGANGKAPHQAAHANHAHQTHGAGRVHAQVTGGGRHMGKWNEHRWSTQQSAQIKPHKRWRAPGLGQGQAGGLALVAGPRLGRLAQQGGDRQAPHQNHPSHGLQRAAPAPSTNGGAHAQGADQGARANARAGNARSQSAPRHKPRGHAGNRRGIDQCNAQADQGPISEVNRGQGLRRAGQPQAGGNEHHAASAHPPWPPTVGHHAPAHPQDEINQATQTKHPRHIGPGDLEFTGKVGEESSKGIRDAKDQRQAAKGRCHHPPGTARFWGRQWLHGVIQARWADSISRRILYAWVWVSMATSSQLRLWPCATGRTTFTPCAKPSGRPPMRKEVAAGSSLPHTV